MSDLLSALTSSSSSSSTSSTSSSYESQADLLVASYQATQQTKLDTLTSKRDTLVSKQTFFSSLNTKLNTLLSAIDTFAEFNSNDEFNSSYLNSANNKFKIKTSVSSDTEYLTASATSDAIEGTNNIKINRLATNDRLIGQQVNDSDSFGLSGVQTFDLNGRTYSVNLGDNANLTYQEAATKIVNAINLTYDPDDDGDKDNDISASYIKDSSGTGRIVFTSVETGQENKITFTSSAAGSGTILDKFGFNDNINQNETSRTLTSGTAAGYKSVNSGDLDALLDVNGIVGIKRSSNEIDDILEGVTLKLLKVQDSDDSEIILKTSNDVSGVESLIKPLIDAYNDVLSFVNENTDMKRGDSAISSLFSNLRSLSAVKVSSINDSNPQMLTEIGIKIGSDGKLSISDIDLLTELLEEDPTKVSSVFTASDGFAAQLYGQVNKFLGSDGIIAARNKSLSSQIDSTDTKYNDLVDKIDRESESLRDEYSGILQLYMEAQSQFNLLSSSYSST